MCCMLSIGTDVSILSGLCACVLTVCFPVLKGHRSDLDQAIELLHSGGELAVAEGAPAAFVRHFRGLRELKRALIRPRDINVPIKCLWLRGPTGIGKTEGATRFLLSLAESYCVWSPKHKDAWFDNYTGQRWIFIDELGPSAIRLGELLRLLQPLPYQLPVHGGVVECAATRFIVTTNVSNALLFPFAPPESVAALERRVTGELSEGDIERFLAMDPALRSDAMKEWIRNKFND